MNIGAYRSGSNPGIDFAIQKIGMINEFLQQDMYEKTDFSEAVQGLQQIFTGTDQPAPVNIPIQPGRGEG